MQAYIKKNKLLVTVVAVLVVVALYLQLSPTPTTAAHHTAIVSGTAVASTADDVANDTHVHFPRYVGSSHDPFVPVVALDNPGGGGSGGLINGAKWQLTGINSINGVTSAVVENSGTNQSVFLQVGDTWNGLRVASITDDTVNLENALGQVTQLGFAAPPPPPGEGAAATIPGLSGGALSASNAPGVSQINPLPPLNPDVSSSPAAAFRRRRGQ
jgi:hypothetical protein